MNDHQTVQSNSTSPVGSISRRGLLRAAGAGAAVVGAGGLLEACSSGIKGASTSSTKAITIGWIHPLTGDLAGFGAADNWVISKIKQTTPYKNGFKVGGKTYPVTIKSYDSQSSVTRAGDLAKTAILDGVDMLFASSTPETVNAVASQAESLGTPLICSNIPWESWYLNLFPKGNPAARHGESQVRGDVLPRRRAPGEVLHPDVEPDPRPAAHQQGGRRRVPERLGRRRVPRGVPADRRGRGLHVRHVLALPGRDHELHLDDLPVQGRQGRLLHERAAAAGLRRHVEAVDSAGLPAEAGHRGQGAAVPDRRLRDGLRGVQRRHRHLVGADPAVEVLVHRGGPASSREPVRVGRGSGSGTPTSATTACSRSPTRPSHR